MVSDPPHLMAGTRKFIDR